MPDENNSPNSTEETSAVVPQDTQEFVSLPPGHDLDQEGAADVTSATVAKIVMIAGDVYSGKTTLLASLFEKFNEGPFAGFLFAGSRTLVGFDQKCYLSTLASGAMHPDTERTPIRETRYLHLRVAREANRDRVDDLLFTDISGEVFRSIADSTEACQSLTVLKRCDHFALLMDGEKLSDDHFRHSALKSGNSLLRSCADAGMLGQQSIVHVLFSKFDKISAAGGEAKEFLKHCKSAIMDRFENRFGRLVFREIASRPDDERVVPFAYGLDEALTDWVQNSLLFVTKPPTPMRPTGLREFQVFGRSGGN